MLSLNGVASNAFGNRSISKSHDRAKCQRWGFSARPRLSQDACRCLKVLLHCKVIVIFCWLHNTQFLIKDIFSQLNTSKAINVLGYICAEVSYSNGRGFFNVVVATSIWITGLLLLLYVFRLHELINEAALTLFEVGFCAIWVILYIVAVFWMIIYGSPVAAFFAFYNAIAHGYYGYYKYAPYLDRAPVVVVMDRNNGRNVVWSQVRRKSVFARASVSCEIFVLCLKNFKKINSFEK